MSALSPEHVVFIAEPAGPDPLPRHRMWAHVAYGLHLGGLVLPVGPLAAVVIAAVLRPKTRGSWLESHLDWQQRTAWLTLLWTWAIVAAAAGVGLAWFGGPHPAADVGGARSGMHAVLAGIVSGISVIAGKMLMVSILSLLAILQIWYLFRVARGWKRLASGQGV